MYLSSYKNRIYIFYIDILNITYKLLPVESFKRAQHTNQGVLMSRSDLG